MSVQATAYRFPLLDAAPYFGHKKLIGDLEAFVMPNVRAFFAVELGREVKSFLADIQNQCKAHARDVKWVNPESMHLTLKFLGPTSTDLISALEEAARDACATVSPFTLSVAGAGAFPGPARPSVVWVGISDPTGAVSELAARLETRVESLGFPREKRPYRPHLTLGRVRRAGPAPDLTSVLRSLEGIVGPSFPVNRLTLFESVLQPSGARYTPLFQVALEARR
jgi:2'-5' RNA ligase